VTVDCMVFRNVKRGKGVQDRHRRKLLKKISR